MAVRAPLPVPVPSKLVQGSIRVLSVQFCVGFEGIMEDQVAFDALEYLQACCE